jgi:SAM-dependent methyltransferase
MGESYPGKLQIWDGLLPALLKGAGGAAPGARGRTSAEDPAALAGRLYAAEVLHASRRPREGAEPFTLQWFLEIEHARHHRQARWLPRLLEFGKHSGETLLGLGPGLGTDWVQYARHGGQVIACSPSAEQLALVQRNFELRGLRGRFLHAPPPALPLETASVDVACVGSLLEDGGTDEPHGLVAEVYRVLKPGGKVLALAPARYDVAFWARRLMPWRPPRLAPLPVATLPLAAPPGAAAGYSARGLRRLFAPFTEPRVHKRHLRRADVPHLWRWLPAPLLERLLGRVLVLKAFKPLSAAIAVSAAA